MVLVLVGNALLIPTKILNKLPAVKRVLLEPTPNTKAVLPSGEYMGSGITNCE